MTRILNLITLLLLTATIAGAESQPKTTITVTGIVTDSDHRHLVGASVMVFENEKILTGISTDTDGAYNLKFKANEYTLTLRVSSIGYFEQTAKLKIENKKAVVNFVLEAKAVEVASIAVRPEMTPRVSERVYDSDRIARVSRQALVPTNPVAALKEPEISRQGSNHSSQIRINGTNPKYYLNGTLLGPDPDHYGMFSVIPSTIVEEIKFYPHGTSADRAQASSITLNTPMPFNAHNDIIFDLSTIEATGTYSVGNESVYLLGAVRKSLLDKLVNSLNISSDRQTIPPTNFEDVYLSTGVRLSPRFRLMLDHYAVRDYLAYNTASSVSASDINTYQNTKEYLTALRFDAVYDKLLVQFNGSFRNGHKRYNAAPGETENPSTIRVDLIETRKSGALELTGTYMNGGWEIKAGDQLDYVSSREITLSQQNWNFLSPFYNSDNPYIYQQALNENYGDYEGQTREVNNAFFVSVAKEFDRFKIENGLRLEYFNHLQNNRPLLSRHTLTFRTSARSRVEFHFGTYAESPTGNILDPYQVLVQDHLDRLEPVRTRLFSVGWSNDLLDIGFFKKDIDHLAVITPDFDNVYDDNGTISGDFLTMRSTGEARFYGGSVSFEKAGFLTPKLSLLTSYAYTHAYKTDDGIDIPYELNAPHKFLAKVDYQLSRRFNIGTELQFRSGYPYSPTYTDGTYDLSQAYTEAFYTEVKEDENSEEFPTNMCLNLYGTYDWGNIELFCSVSNVTNQANPIINARSGYIYDAGILPMLGLKWRF
ncbi:MAG: carboxypeptidase-like regulatory domain-containing protein [Candidatus Zixiibacteriota bacterium]